MSWFNKKKQSTLPSLCVLPWTHIFVGNEGVLGVCCMSEYRGKGIVNEKGVPFKIDSSQQDIKKAWNSKYMHNLRQQMLSGQWPKVCESCRKNEAVGIKSYRQHSNSYALKSYKKISQLKPHETEAPFKVTFIDVRLGNLCNLKCRMCHPIASKKWMEDWKRLSLQPYTPIREAEVLNMNWFEKEPFWRNMEMFLPHLDKLHFAGGEPLLINKSYEFLQNCIDGNYAKNISLTYNTNLTVLPDQCFELWSHFKSLTLMVSLDGTDEVNKYIRYPSKWKDIVSNLNKLVGKQTSLNLEPIQIICTVQIHNIFHLADLFTFIDSFKNIVDTNVSLNLLTTPSCYSIQVLPIDLKNLAKERLLKFKDKFCQTLRYQRLNKHIEGVIDFMYKADLSSELNEFRRRTRILDKSRQQNISDTVPELAPLVYDDVHDEFHPKHNQSNGMLL